MLAVVSGGSSLIAPCRMPHVRGAAKRLHGRFIARRGFARLSSSVSGFDGGWASHARTSELSIAGLQSEMVLRRLSNMIGGSGVESLSGRGANPAVFAPADERS